MSPALATADLVLRARGLAFRHPAAPGERAFALVVDELDVREGEVLALCGPSGSGKSTLLGILAGLLRPDSGRVELMTEEAGPVDLHGVPTAEWRRLRRHVGFVHQDPREYLNDRRKVVDIVADPLAIHARDDRRAGSSDDRSARLFLLGGPSRRDRRDRAIAMLRKVGLSEAQAERTPETLSGGQRQRVAIARALVANPRLVFLDEPTSALDVSVQASIVALLRRIRTEAGRAAFVLVTHDLPLARQLADRVAILDDGRLVELGDADRVFREPASPVTRGLLGIARADLVALADETEAQA